MNPANFELQHSDVDQPKLLDGECATRDWPMPAGGVWVPRPEPEPAPVYEYWQCQACGAPIGMVGRFLRGLGFEVHNCNTHKYDRNR